IEFVKGKKGNIIVFGETNLFAAIYLKYLLKLPLIYCMRSNFIEIRKYIIKKRDRSQLKRFLKVGYLSLYKQLIRISCLYINKIVVQNREDKEFVIHDLKFTAENITLIPNNISVRKSEQNLLQKNDFFNGIN